MAKITVAAVFGLVVGVVAGAALQIRAQEPDLESLAADAGVPVDDLAAALNSQPGVSAREYLTFLGKLGPVAPVLSGAVQRADCIIAKESGGLDVPNRQGSGASGPGQYMHSTWQAHTALYRALTGYTGALSLHSLSDVRRVMAAVLGAYPWLRSAWTVGGCG